MPFVETTAGRVWYAERGSGRPVVLLHAALHDHRDFDRITGPLAGRYRTIAVDWPGHGDSDPVPAGTTGDGPLFARVLAELVTKLALPPAVVVGNSVGGYAAARLAIDRPDRVAGLVLVNSAGFHGLNPAERTLCRVLGMPWLNRRIVPHLVRRYMKPVNEHDRAVTARVTARARTRDGATVDAALWRSFTAPGYDLRGAADRITAPVLLIWGARDIILPARAGRHTHAALPGSRLELLPVGRTLRLRPGTLPRARRPVPARHPRLSIRGSAARDRPCA